MFIVDTVLQNTRQAGKIYFVFSRFGLDLFAFACAFFPRAAGRRSIHNLPRKS